MSPKSVEVEVVSFLDKQSLTFAPKALGKEVFDKVSTGIMEQEYFGLRFTNKRGKRAWLKLDKKLSAQVKKFPVIMDFLIKLYPEDPKTDIIDYKAIQLFYLQGKHSIVTDTVYAGADQLLLLAALSVRVDQGEYDPSKCTTGYLGDMESLVPKRYKYVFSIFEQYDMDKNKWEEKITDIYQSDVGMSEEDAMVRYLEILVELDMYGVNYFEIRNKKGSNLYFGVDALGVNIYSRDNKLKPQVGFPWSEIGNVSYSNTKFKVRPSGKDTTPLIFFSTKENNKQIFELCKENHALYLSRRMPDSAQKTFMKNQKLKEREQRATHQAQIQAEIRARLAAEKEQMALKEQAEQFKKESEQLKEALKANKDLQNATSVQLQESTQSRLELLAEYEALKRMIEELQENKKNQEDEKENFTSQILEREEQMEVLKRKIDDKDRVLAELEEQQRAAVEKAESIAIASAPPPPPVTANSDADSGAIVNGAVNHEQDSESEEEEHEHDTTEKGGDVTEGAELTTDGHVLPQTELETIPITQRDDATRDKLQILQKELADARIESKLSHVDREYLTNVEAGRDKYQTLRQIRAGNTRKRIDQFENI